MAPASRGVFKSNIRDFRGTKLIIIRMDTLNITNLRFAHERKCSHSSFSAALHHIFKLQLSLRRPNQFLFSLASAKSREFFCCFLFKRIVCVTRVLPVKDPHIAQLSASTGVRNDTSNVHEGGYCTLTCSSTRPSSPVALWVRWILKYTTWFFFSVKQIDE